MGRSGLFAPQCICVNLGRTDALGGAIEVGQRELRFTW
jgi:hypothetical protein